MVHRHTHSPLTNTHTHTHTHTHTYTHTHTHTHTHTTHLPPYSTHTGSELHWVDKFSEPTAWETSPLTSPQHPRTVARVEPNQTRVKFSKETDSSWIIPLLSTARYREAKSNLSPWGSRTERELCLSIQILHLSTFAALQLLW
jgi:hypothetical protein